MSCSVLSHVWVNEKTTQNTTHGPRSHVGYDGIGLYDKRYHESKS